MSEMLEVVFHERADDDHQVRKFVHLVVVRVNLYLVFFVVEHVCQLKICDFAIFDFSEQVVKTWLSNFVLVGDDVLGSSNRHRHRELMDFLLDGFVQRLPGAKSCVGVWVAKFGKWKAVIVVYAVVQVCWAIFELAFSVDVFALSEGAAVLDAACQDCILIPQQFFKMCNIFCSMELLHIFRKQEVHVALLAINLYYKSNEAGGKVGLFFNSIQVKFFSRRKTWQKCKQKLTQAFSETRKNGFKFRCGNTPFHAKLSQEAR